MKAPHITREVERPGYLAHEDRVLERFLQVVGHTLGKPYFFKDKTVINCDKTQSSL